MMSLRERGLWFLDSFISDVMQFNRIGPPEIIGLTAVRLRTVYRKPAYTMGIDVNKTPTTCTEPGQYHR